MLRKSRACACFLIGAVFCISAGCRPTSPPAPIAPMNPAGTPGPTSAGPAPGHETADSAAVQKAVDSALKSHSEQFPPRVRIKTVTVQDGVADLDFSTEFNRLSSMGDSTEAAAQRTLRGALAGFPGIDKMRVTVEGKPFDSQMTDWTTPFAVRDGSGDSGQGGGAAKGGG